MKELPENSKSERVEKAFELMYSVAELKSDKEFETEMKNDGFKFLEDYSYGSLEKPRLCTKVVQEIDNPKKIYVINRGLSWSNMGFWSLLEETPDIIAISRGHKPEGFDILQEKLDNIKRDFSIEEITIVGHSRGALVVDYNADSEWLTRDGYKPMVVSIESPGTAKDFEVNNPNYLEYISNFPSIINACGTSSSKNTIAINNHVNIDAQQNFVNNSFISHGITSLKASLKDQSVLEERISCFDTAYELFLGSGGKSCYYSKLAVEFCKNFRNIQNSSNKTTNKIVNILDQAVDYVRPNSLVDDDSQFWLDESDFINLSLIGQTLIDQDIFDY